MIFKAVLDKKIHLINLKGKESIEELRKAIAFSFKLPSDSFEMSYLDEDGDQITLSDAQDFAILTSFGQKIMKVKVRELKIGSDLEVLQDNPDKESVKDESMEVIEPLKIEERLVEVKQEVFEVRQELIEEKFKKFLPEIISRVKTEIREEISERSRISDRNQPLIIEDEEEVLLPKETEKIAEPKIQEQDKNSSVVVHKGVTCDSCGKKDIEGIRYKCAVCANFDFCQQCESSIEHAHPFLKIRTLKQTPIKVFTIINDEDNNLEINGHRIPSQGGFDNLVQKGINFVHNFINNQRSHQGQRHCPFFRNRFGCQRREEEKQEEKPKKMEEKAETEVKPAEKKQKTQQFSNDQQERLIENAQYLSQLGFDFDKCYQWASTYPKLSKEEFVDFCLTTPGFLN